MLANKVESFLVSTIPGAYTSTYSFLLLIARKINFDSSEREMQRELELKNISERKRVCVCVCAGQRKVLVVALCHVV